ncbi:hypothetical protein WH52_02685 [Tenacibaculum holothuriorum]|uniref:DKNYY family protein n=1 Tax=Tenacibaculum holothuriorum TaxID=1635173 RepID=A0A1Y2PGD6_9FLAO|nr:DKNYY domain-containing protein [Tenacibaculum holothuriorum]OSY89556.1 hypothetical protein WH52_02685 [Tenacibaculum holothuriorum]
MRVKKYVFAFILFTILSCKSDYVIEDDKVYYKYWSFSQGGWNKMLLKSVDYKTFSKINTDENIYGKDKNFVFFKEKIIKGADPNTFKVLIKGYAIDQTKAFYYTDSITNSSSKGFEVIDDYYSKDLKDVFYKTEGLNVCSVDSFKLMFLDEEKWSRWSTDGCSYYKENFKVPTLDYKNLKVYKNFNVSTDKYFLYYLNKKITYEKKWEKYIDTIDVNTFKVLGFNHYKDKHGCINMNGRIMHSRLECK